MLVGQYFDIFDCEHQIIPMMKIPDKRLRFRESGILLILLKNIHFLIRVNQNQKSAIVISHAEQA